ncbi:MAG: biosynthetic-type acetolactate synthase large subunit [Chromatiales bacterium]|nr:biosynthetic-type acetolactate synthase large subunit [Chromatiales bacterium]
MSDRPKLSGAEIIIRTLADLGVDTIFGYSGGAILPTYDAIFLYNEVHRKVGGKDPINLIVPANEQGAGFMAAGYARASGRPGVALATSGPGATNSVTPVRDSLADSVPMILICGQVPTAAMGTDAFQEAPIVNIMSSCAKHVLLVTDPEKLEATIRAAFEIAVSGRPGPVVIDIPKDIQNWQGYYDGHAKLDLLGYQARIDKVVQNRIQPKHAEEFFSYLKASKRPLLYVGGGVINSNASGILRSFAERYGIPVVTTLMGIGSVDTTHELSLHMLGMHGTAYANYAVEDCDLLIAVGARFDDRVAGRPDAFAPSAKAILHIDIDTAEINKVVVANWAHNGDAHTVLSDLIKHDNGFTSDYQEWHKHIANLKQKHKLDYDHNSELIQPYEVLETLNELTKGEAIITTGVGQHQMWAAQYLDYKHPRSWLTSGSMGTMGFGLPAAIGAQFACPDKIVCDIDGDGSLRMNIGELETVITYDLPVKILLLNNYGDGMVRQWQKTFFKNRFSGSDKSLFRKDFVQAAKADGFPFAKRIDKREQLRSYIEQFVATKTPAFLEVIIDQDAGVYPMVSPGATYKQMITGDYILARKENEYLQNEEQIVDPVDNPNTF